MIIVYFIAYFSYSIGLSIFPDHVILSSSWYRGLKMLSVGLITETLRDYRRCWWETKTRKWREMRLKVNHQGMGIWSMRVWVFELSEYGAWAFWIMRSRVRVFELQVFDIVKIFLFSFFPFQQWWAWSGWRWWVRLLPCSLLSLSLSHTRWRWPN